MEIQHIRKAWLWQRFDDFLRFCISKSFKDRTFFLFAIDWLSKNSRGLPYTNHRFRQNFKSYGCFKTLNSIFSQGAYSIIYFRPKKFTFFYALKDGIDHLLGKFFFCYCYFQRTVPLIFCLSNLCCTQFEGLWIFYSLNLDVNVKCIFLLRNIQK